MPANTACSEFQASLRHVWASGSTIAELTGFLTISKDQFIRLRTVLNLPLRLDRSKRAKPPRHRDPTPAEIAKACAKLREAHMKQRMAEDPGRVYSRSERDMPRYRLEAPQPSGDDQLERFMDECCDD